MAETRNIYRVGLDCSIKVGPFSIVKHTNGSDTKFESFSVVPF